MAHTFAYLPVLLFAMLIAAFLFISAADRNAQAARAKHSARMVYANFHQKFAHGFNPRNFLPRRVNFRRAIFWAAVLYLISYIAAYQRLQDAIADELIASGAAEISVGSLIIPHSAFFRRAYVADAGFYKSKSRARAELQVRGNVWSGFAIDIDEASLAKINKLAGKKFVFSYLTDVKILRPAIHEHMRELLAAKQIAKYEIETFDNRGPYLIVALGTHRSRRAEDPAKIANEMAEGLHAKLTKVKQLKVNRVVVKIAEPGAYINDNTVNLLARGTAGNY